MERSLNGRTALVTGSNAGLGLAIAQALAARGCAIMLHGLEEPAQAADLCRSIVDTHATRCSYFGSDFRRLASLEAMIAAIEAGPGFPDILVNNAAIRHSAPVEEFGREQWDESLSVNLSAAFHLVRWALPSMRRREWGRIVNISSIYASRAVRDRIGYVTTKTALAGFTRAVALETAQDENLTCNAVCPGTVDTPAILERIARSAADRGIAVAQAQAEYLGERQPTRRFVAAERVAGLVSFLCSEEAADITGASVPIDGAWSAA